MLDLREATVLHVPLSTRIKRITSTVSNASSDRLRPSNDVALIMLGMFVVMLIIGLAHTYGHRIDQTLRLMNKCDGNYQEMFL